MSGLFIARKTILITILLSLPLFKVLFFSIYYTDWTSSLHHQVSSKLGALPHDSSRTYSGIELVIFMFQTNIYHARTLIMLLCSYICIWHITCVLHISLYSYFFGISYINYSNSNLDDDGLNKRGLYNPPSEPSIRLNWSLQDPFNSSQENKL